MIGSSNELNEIVAELNVARNDILLPENTTVQLYFDTADVRRAVLGAYQYISWPDGTNISVDVDEFEKPVVLVDCLLAAKFLGSFAMLPPHQAEFLRQLKNDEAFQRQPGKIDQSEFLKKVRIDCPWGFESSVVQNKREVKNFLRKQAGENTERFFKAIQCVRMPWWEQLRSLRSSKTFMPTTVSFDYPALLQGSELPRLLALFQRRRGKVHYDHLVTKNNFADAISLLILVELTKRFNNGDDNKIPRFLDSTGIFHDVAKEAGLITDLTISVSGIKSNALVTLKYFLYRASLHFATEKRDVYDSLREAVPTGKEHARELQRLESHLPNRLNWSGPLRNQLRQFIDLSFLENVWLKTIAFDDIQDIATKWTTEAVRTERFRETVDQTIDSTIKDVLRDAAEYKKFSDASLGLRQEILIWRRKLHSTANVIPDGEPHAETEMGLFRFNPNARTMDRVRDTWVALSDDSLDDKNVTGLHVWYEFVSYYVDLEKVNHDQPQPETLDNAEFVTAMLWAIKADSWILELFKSSKYRMSFFITIVYTAAVLRLGRDLNKAETIIEQAQRELDSLKDDNDKGETAWDIVARNSSVAYLWFHLWQAKWNLPAWWRCTKKGNAEPLRREGSEKYLQRAIKCIDAAWLRARALKDSDDRQRKRLIYITNQRLYYLVEQGSDERLNDMIETRQEMEGFQRNARELWQPTYSDTLARYFAYRAYLANSLESWEKFMKSANYYCDEARSAKKSDQIVRHFEEYLTDAWEAGFSPRETVVT